MRGIVLFILLSISGRCFSQNSIKYDSTYKEISQKLLISAPEESLIFIDSLFDIANNNEEIVNTLWLKATLLRKYGLKAQAIIILERADKLAKCIPENSNYIARINGLLSTLYRENGLIQPGKKALDKAIAVSKKIKDKNDFNKFQGNLQQELAYYAMEEENYVTAISLLELGRSSFKKLDSGYDPNFHLAVMDQLIGKIFLKLIAIDSAFFYLSKARKQLENSLNPKSSLMGFIYNDLGKVHMLKKDFDQAKYFYLNALDIAEATNFYNLKIDVFESLKDYYREVLDDRNYFIYDDKRMKLIEEENQTQKIIANRFIENLQQEKNLSRKKYKKQLILLIGGSSTVVIFTLNLYLYRRKKDYKRFQQLMREHGTSKANIKTDETIAEKADSNSTVKSDRGYMSKETENDILKKLNKYEKSKCFLNKNTSLTSVSAKLEINNRYLSYVIKKHYQSDFASYINEMRINYIIGCLRNNPAYLKYKISYLADESGFSSHSRFTITFKKVTGISPSVFIKHLRNEKMEINS